MAGRFLGGVLAAAVAAGPAQGAGFFPIGIYAVNDPAAVGKIGEAGFNTIQTYSRDPRVVGALAAAAGRKGMRLLAFPRPLIGAGVDPSGYPMAAWYLADEPDVTGMSPADLAARDREARAWSPGVPTAFVIGQGEPARRFGRIADVIMIDWYPVPHLPLDSVAEELDIVRASVPAGKPVWMVLQAFNWRDYRQRDPSKPRIGRFPTREEIRFMSYLAVIHGADGLFYYQFGSPGGKTLPERPAEWSAVARVVGEIASLRSVLEEGEPAEPPEATPGLETRAWRHGGFEYAVLLNRLKSRPVEVPATVLAREWEEVRKESSGAPAVLSGEGLLAPSSVLVVRRRI